MSLSGNFLLLPVFLIPPAKSVINSFLLIFLLMEALKYDSLGNCRVTLKTGFEFLLKDPLFLSSLEVVKTLKPLSVPLRLLNADGKPQFFHVRRTRRNHFPFLQEAAAAGASFPNAVMNIHDPEVHRFYLVTTYGPVQPLVDFLSIPAVSNKRKLAVLKGVVNELVKLNKTGSRHGNVIHENIYVTQGDGVMLYDPEMDEELVEHIQSDFDQYREMLFHLERELDHEPEALWTTVKNDAYFKTLK